MTLITNNEIRLLSIVEALTVTGPVKPLLMFSPLARNGLSGHPKVSHVLMTTRRTASTPDHRGDNLYQSVADAGIDYITVQERYPFDPRVLSGMAQTIRRIKPTIVETHDCKSHFLYFLLRLRNQDLRQAKWIAFHHGYTRTSWKIFLYQQLDRLTLRNADRVVTLCKPFAKMLALRGVSPSNISIISNAVAARESPPVESITKARQAFNISPDECVIITVGRLSVEKGQDDLLSAFKQALGELPNPLVRLVFVGDGPERARLEQIAAPLGNRVVFAGHVSDPWPLFHTANIFALPSHSEGSPLVIFEAMAASVPIVATTVGGVPETLEDNVTALLVPPRKPELLAAAFLKLINDPALRQRIGSAGFAALIRFSPSAYTEKLLTIYENTLNAQ